MRVLDAGCGGGRNLVYLLREGYEVFASDQSPEAIAQIRTLAATIAPNLSADNFHLESIEDLSYPDNSFDVVLCSAVLHFARDDEHFRAMLLALWRVLRTPRPALLPPRLAASAWPHQRLAGGRFLAARRHRSGSCVDEALLLRPHRRNSTPHLVDPLKTTVVQDQRCMTTWVLRKAER